MLDPISSPSDSPGKGLSRLHQPASEARVYRGRITGGEQCEVWFENPTEGPVAIPYALPLHLEICSHSPSGFGWGYGGSGAAQLSLALLMNATGSRELALARYHDFKRDCVSAWGEEWSITAGTIQTYVATAPVGTRRPLLFPAGTIVTTPSALAAVTVAEMQTALQRHLTGDWGELNQADWFANQTALNDGTRLVSAYLTKSGHRFWIITEADRTVTTILLPEDY